MLCYELGFPTASSREGQAGAPGPQNIFTTVVITKDNSEDKEALAKLMEAFRTNYNEICSHCRDNIPAPKSVAGIAKLQKAKAKDQHQTGLSVHC